LPFTGTRVEVVEVDVGLVEVVVDPEVPEVPEVAVVVVVVVVVVDPEVPEVPEVAVVEVVEVDRPLLGRRLAEGEEVQAARSRPQATSEPDVARARRTAGCQAAGCRGRGGVMGSLPSRPAPRRDLAREGKAPARVADHPVVDGQPPPGGGLGGRQGGGAPGEDVLERLQVDPPSVEVDGDGVPLLDQGEGSAHGGLGGDLADDEPLVDEARQLGVGDHGDLGGEGGALQGEDEPGGERHPRATPGAEAA
jgi:hypothetical protein